MPVSIIPAYKPAIAELAVVLSIKTVDLTRSVLGGSISTNFLQETKLKIKTSAPKSKFLYFVFMINSL
ncbi:hypothetical protein D3C86_1404620 [compost metagenome]